MTTQENGWVSEEMQPWEGLLGSPTTTAVSVTESETIVYVVYIYTPLCPKHTK